MDIVKKEVHVKSLGELRCYKKIVKCDMYHAREVGPSLLLYRYHCYSAGRKLFHRFYF